MKSLAWLLACAMTVGACSDPAAVDSQREIARELRALRTALATNAVTSSPTASDRTGSPGAVGATIATAMEPLREVLVQLVRDQHGLEAQQQALTGELKRWSQLLAQTVAAGARGGTNPQVAGAAKAEVDALVQRLTALEQQLQSQEARHQKVEQLLINALDKTSSKLEEFLRRVEPGSGQEPSTAPAESPSNPTGSAPGTAGPSKTTPGTGRSSSPAGAGTTSTGNGGSEPDLGGQNEAPEAGAGGAQAGANRAQASANREQLARALGDRRSPALWWFGVAAVGLILAGFFALWLARENRAGLQQAREDLANPPEAEGAPELWAAAALLGEAVGRLKDNRTEPGAGAAAQGIEGVAMPETAVPAESISGAGPVAQPEAEPEPLAAASMAGDADPFDDEFVLDEGPILADLEGVPPTAMDDAESGEAGADADLPTKVLPSNPPQDRARLDRPPPDTPRPAPVGGPSDPATPEPRHLRVLSPDSAAAAARIQAVLAAEPRVLQRPEPTCRATGPTIEVRYTLLPATPAAARARLESRLRTVAR